MNGFHFAHMVSRLAGLPRSRSGWPFPRGAGRARPGRGSARVACLLALRAVSGWLPVASGKALPTLDLVRSSHACRLAVVGPGEAGMAQVLARIATASTTAASQSPVVATVTPAVVHGPAETATARRRSRQGRNCLPRPVQPVSAGDAAISALRNRGGRGACAADRAAPPARLLPTGPGARTGRRDRPRPPARDRTRAF